MQQYTNRFNIAKNQDGSEVILNFYQNVPQFPDPTDQETIVSELKTEHLLVSSLVMTGQCAHNLLRVLQEILDETPTSGPSAAPK